MSAAQHLLALEDCAGADTAQVGGKARGLGQLIGFGLPVPPGFAVTAQAYRYCIERAGLAPQIASLVDHATDAATARTASLKISQLFAEPILAEEIAEGIAARYRALGEPDIPVAVRSSATAEDLADASFAGQQDTYLWVSGANAVVAHVMRCWASLFTDRAILYRARLQIAPQDLAMAVVVQQMVPAAAAGVMMTLEPVSGDRSTIYLEGTYGLGEGVVRGDVGVDRFWVDKRERTLTRSVIESKAQSHQVDLTRGTVALADVDPTLRDEPCLNSTEVVALAQLGRRVEQDFEAPMDIEWAVDHARNIFLLQARPETVWSRRAESSEHLSYPTPPDPASAVRPAPSPERPEDWNPLHDGAPADSHWTTTNVGEAMPGVLTPLSWSVWRPVGRALPEFAYAIGAISARERRHLSDPNTQPMRIFYGRAAFQLEFFAMLGDRLPGTTGPEAAKSLLGRIPEGLQYHPTRNRIPAIAWRFPKTFFKVPGQVRAATVETDQWYRRAIDSLPGMGRPAATALLADARARLVDLVTLQTTAVIAGIQPVYDALESLVTRAGVGDLATLSGAGGAEMLGVVSDLWKVSRGELGLDAVVRSHGFHGPMEGELSSRVWREDPSPLATLVAEYARRDDSQDPLIRERSRQDEATRMRPALVAALGGPQRLLARPILKLAAQRLPLRGVVKVSLLQAFDVARASARRLGEGLTAAGYLDTPEDVFYLTFEELTGVLPASGLDLIAKRRQRRAAYQHVEIPSDWAGTPTPAVPTEDLDRHPGAVLTGIGVSAGSAEGVVRVLRDPSHSFRSDEILVAPTTDPSWSSIMFLCKALVVDIGGALSHAAVVARELGVPCVVNTRTGTKALQTGDLVRVDGAAGTVEVLERAFIDDTTEACSETC